MYTYNYTYPNELYHYGVKGMKWGVRRAARIKSVYADRASKQININKSAVKVSDKFISSGRGSDNRRLTSSEIKSIKKDRNMYAKAVKEWMSARDDIMSMKVAEVKPKDIKQRYKSAKSAAGGIYIT